MESIQRYQYYASSYSQQHGNADLKSKSTSIDIASGDPAVGEGQQIVSDELDNEQGTPLGDPPTQNFSHHPPIPSVLRR